MIKGPARLDKSAIAANYRYVPEGPPRRIIREIVCMDLSAQMPEAVLLPHGSMDILFHFDDRCCRAFVIGAWTTVRRKSRPMNGQVLIVRFRPGGLSQIFPGIADELANSLTPLTSLGDRGLECLQDQLTTASDMHSRIVLLEKYIAGRLQTPLSPRYALLSESISALLTDTVTVRELTTITGYSARSLHRLFLQELGISPKTYGRLARFRRALSDAQKMTAPDWAGLAVGAGYFDQSHMIRDFQSVAQATPKQLLAELNAVSLFQRD